jgi:hypothetical protein
MVYLYLNAVKKCGSESKGTGQATVDDYSAVSLLLPIIYVMSGMIRAIPAAIRKTILRFVIPKKNPIIIGPIVIPRGTMVLLKAINPARYSSGAIPAEITL